MKNAKVRSIVSLVTNAVIFVCTVLSVLSFFTDGGDGNMQVDGTGCFIFFTVDSNILCAIASAVIVVCQIKCLASGNYVLPKWTVVFKYIGSCAVALTFTTVVCFLMFIYGFGAMFSGYNLFMHLTTPLVACASYVLCEIDSKKPFAMSFLGVVPTVIYGAVYLVNVIVTKTWSDFYSFNSGPLQGLWPLTLVVMLGASYGLSVLIHCLGNKAVNK